jgi:hypothetical protein
MDKKDEFGDVSTPVEMIENIYNNFPANVFKMKHFVWLDPCVGTGNFPMVLYTRLLDGLKDIIPDWREREKHIIEKMIWMVEINPANVSLCKSNFERIFPDRRINIVQADYLSWFPPDGWPQQYDCITGNPPYNAGGLGRRGSKRIHIPFVEKSLSLLKPHGLLSFITPPSWREAKSRMNRLIHDNGSLLFVEMYTANEGRGLFGCHVQVDSFIFQKGLFNYETRVVDETDTLSKFRLELDHHIPNYGYSIFKKLYERVNEVGHVTAFRTAEMTTSKKELFNDDGVNKIIHLITQKGPRIMKSDKSHSLQNVSKMLVNGLGIPYVFHDKNGEYGVSQSPVVILKPSIPLVLFLESPIFTYLCWGLRITGNNTLPYIFDAVPKFPDNLETIESIVDWLGFTKNELRDIYDLQKN